MTDWHRLFGLILTDFFTGSPFVVETERDLSEQQQKLDILIIRKRAGEFTEPLPDGFGELVNHNLVTFKSYQETLTAWSLQELLGHYVSYRKLVSPAPNNLLPETEFRSLAFCVRYPQDLAGEIELSELTPVVYDCICVTVPVRVIVAHRLPEEEQNAICHLFSALPQQVIFGALHYRQRSPLTIAELLSQLLFRYSKEGLPMPVLDVKKEVFDFWMEVFKTELTPEQQVEILRGTVPPEQLLRALPPELLQALPREEVERFLKKTDGQSPDAPPKTDGAADAEDRS